MNQFPMQQGNDHVQPMQQASPEKYSAGQVQSVRPFTEPFQGYDPGPVTGCTSSSHGRNGFQGAGHALNLGQPPALYDRLKMLEGELNELSERAQILENRLEPVLMPCGPSTVQMAAGQMVPTPPKSAAIEQVDKVRATVRTITDQLRAAEHRLQL